MEYTWNTWNTVLGPILFAQYVNDFPECIDEGKTVIYADDAVVLVPGLDIHKLEHANTQLGKIEQWFSHNTLTLMKIKLTRSCSPYLPNE